MNIVVYPVFFSGLGDRKLFSELVGQGLGLSVGARLVGEDYRVLVVTNDADVAGMAAELGVEAHCTSFEDDFSPPDIPRGTRAAVRVLLAGKAGSLIEKSGVAFVDFRAPDITHRLISGILAKVNKQPGLWIGVSEPEDHPVQLDIWLEIIATELHMYSDPDSEMRLSARVSREFPINLSVGSKSRQGDFFCLPSDGLGADFEPMTWSEAQRMTASRSVVMEYAGDGKGRRVIGKSAPWPKDGLIPFCGGLDESMHMIASTTDGKNLDIYVRSLPEGIYRLRLFTVPYRNAGREPTWESWFHLPIQGGSSVMAGKRAFIGALTRVPAPSGNGLFVVLERQVTQGNADRKVPFCVEGGGWKVTEDLCRVNLARSCRIAGRQDFPEIWEIDSSLLALEAAHLDCLLSLSFVDGARGYCLGSRSSFGRAARLGFSVSSLSNETHNAPQAKRGVGA